MVYRDYIRDLLMLIAVNAGVHTRLRIGWNRLCRRAVGEDEKWRWRKNNYEDIIERAIITEVYEANLINWVCTICTQYGACTNFVLYILNGEYVQISVRYKYASSTNLNNLACTIYTRC